jgi:uncharacterized protein YraI
MKYLKVLCALAAVLVAAPMSAFAQQYANMAREANLRAGPSRDYPIVAVLPAGMSVWVDGCINGYRWCDVTVGPDRGWLYAGNIIYPYEGGRVPLLNYGAVIGIGIIAFSLGDYWDHHYQSRPWYPQRQHWIDRPQPFMRPDVGQVRPLPPRPPPRADGVQHLPADRPPGDVRHPSPRTLPADGQVPLRIHPQGGNRTWTQGVQPDGVPRPRADQVPARKQRPPQSQPPKENQRPPQGQRGGDKRPPWEEPPGGGKK